MPLAQKHTQLQALLKEYGRVAVAFSGGVDSALVLKCALDTLGVGNVVALFAQSELQTPDEIEQAVRWPANNGYTTEDCLEIIHVQPLTWKDVADNPEDRCYHCKQRLYQLFCARMKSRGHVVLLDGTNCDDLRCHRPGLRAIDELGVRMPLVEAGLNKAEVRILSRQLNLSTWDRPSSSCLATRIPAGMPITAQRLLKVATLEKELRRFGFVGCRIRLSAHQDDAVQITLQNSEIEILSDLKLRTAVLRVFQHNGINTVLLNLAGRGETQDEGQPETP